MAIRSITKKSKSAKSIRGPEYFDSQTYKLMNRKIKVAKNSNAARLVKKYDLYKRQSVQSLKTKLSAARLEFSDSDSKPLLIKRLLLGPNFVFQPAHSPTRLPANSPANSHVPQVPSKRYFSSAMRKKLQEELLKDSSKSELETLIKEYGQQARQLVGYHYSSSTPPSSSSKLSHIMDQFVFSGAIKSRGHFPTVCYMDLVEVAFGESSATGRKRSNSFDSSKSNASFTSTSTKQPKSHKRQMHARNTSQDISSSSSSCSSSSAKAPAFNYIPGRDPKGWLQFHGSSDIRCKRSNTLVDYNEDPNSVFFMALDPGYANFYTAVSKHGDIFELGNGVYESLKKLESSLSILYTRLQSRNRKTLVGIKNAIWDLNKEKKTLIDKLHLDCTTFLSSVDLLLIPPVIGISNSNHEKHIVMQHMDHPSFYDGLLLKMEFEGNQVLNVTEGYSTICCSNCGQCDHKMGGSRKFNCKGCGMQMGRDANASWNILLFALMHILQFKKQYQ